MPRIMLLIPSASYRSPDFMKAATELGIEVVVGSDKSNPLESLHPDKQIGLDFADPEEGARQIERFAQGRPLAAIVAVDDAGTRLAARASWRLELPYNPVEAVDATRNKALLRERLANAGLPSPPYQVVSVEDSPSQIASNLTFPVVAKPLALSASRGVIRADTPEQFVDAFERIRHILNQPECAAEAGNLADKILIEGYVPGAEVSVEGLLHDGQLQVLAIFDKPDPLEGPFFEETIYVTPSRLEPTLQDRVVAVTEQATAAIGLRDGPVHAEMRINDQGVYPIDIAARSIGGLCSRTLSFGTGMSLEELILRHATGNTAASAARESQAAGVMMIPIPRSGTLKSVNGVAEAEAVPLIESVTMTTHIESAVVPLPEGGDYLGFIFARGASPEAVELALQQAHDQLDFRIE